MLVHCLSRAADNPVRALEKESHWNIILMGGFVDERLTSEVFLMCGSCKLVTAPSFSFYIKMMNGKNSSGLKFKA